MFITRQIPRDSYRAGGPRGSSTWTQTVNVSGYLTVQWKKGESPPTTSREVVGETADKLGAYRGQSSFQALNILLRLGESGATVVVSVDSDRRNFAFTGKGLSDECVDLGRRVRRSGMHGMSALGAARRLVGNIVQTFWALNQAHMRACRNRVS